MSGSSILRSFYPIVGTKTTLRWTFVNIGGNRWTFMSWCYDWRMSFSVSHFALLDEVPRDSPHSFVILHRSDCLDCFCLVLESRLELNHDIFSLRCYPVFFFYFAFEERSSLHPALYASCWHCASERVHSLPRIAQSEPLRSASCYSHDGLPMPFRARKFTIREGASNPTFLPCLVVISDTHYLRFLCRLPRRCS